MSKQYTIEINKFGSHSIEIKAINGDWAVIGTNKEEILSEAMHYLVQYVNDIIELEIK